MHEDRISIGVMAKMNNVSVPTLRLYDQMGLLRPAYVNPDSGYRYYDMNQNARLDMIAYMKELGMSLAEISNMLEREDIALVEEILARKNEQIHAQMRELKARHEAVERAIASIERYRKSPATGTISLEYIDRRRISGMPCRENFYEKGIRSYENALFALRRMLIERGMAQIHTYNVGTSIAQENFENGCFVPDQVFLFLASNDRENDGTVLVCRTSSGSIWLPWLPAAAIRSARSRVRTVTMWMSTDLHWPKHTAAI